MYLAGLKLSAVSPRHHTLPLKTLPLKTLPLKKRRGRSWQSSEPMTQFTNRVAS